MTRGVAHPPATKVKPLAMLALMCGIAMGAPAAPVSFESAARDAHATLTKLCDDFGGRLTGSPNNRGALDRLSAELRSLGLEPRLEEFEMPGWERGADSVAMLRPIARPLRVAALGYTQPCEAFDADVVSGGTGRAEDYPDGVRGKVLLLASSASLPASEFAAIAARRGVKGILFIDREGGGQLLARTGSFVGEPLPVPVFSISQEEGLWMQRLLDRGEPVRVRMEVRSKCVPVRTANLHVILPGGSPERIIVGAHFDSWDLGQGTMDNGLGIAQLLAIAHALHGRELPRTVELIWFNGEELGLWGSRHAAGLIGDMPIVAMINLDMVGVPIAVNALGDASLLPALKRWNEGRGEHRLEKGVENVNWLGSDHTPFQLKGVRAITFNAPIPRESVRYYHDFGDTIDKLPEPIVVDSTEVIGDLVLALANDSAIGAFRRKPAETKELFIDRKLDKKMRGIGLWPE